MNKRFKIKRGIIIRQVDEDYLLIPRFKSVDDDLRMFVTNETGYIIFKNLKKRKSIQEIIDLLRKNYKIDKKSVKKDILAFINKMEKMGLLEEE